MRKFIDRPNLKHRARTELAGDYRTAIPVTLLILAIVGVPCALAATGLWFALAGLKLWLRILLISVITEIIFVLLKGPVSYGRAKFYLNMSRNATLEVSQLISGFNRLNIYWKTVLLKLAQVLSALVGFVLLIVPGFVVMYRYSMAYYALLDEPALTIKQALAKSSELTKGNKGQLFSLDLSYLGWWLVSLATLGIALLWVLPNVNTTTAYYYNVMADKLWSVQPKVDRNYGESGGEIPPSGK